MKLPLLGNVSLLVLLLLAAAAWYLFLRKQEDGTIDLHIGEVTILDRVA